MFSDVFFSSSVILNGSDTELCLFGFWWFCRRLVQSSVLFDDNSSADQNVPEAAADEDVVFVPLMNELI